MSNKDLTKIEHWARTQSHGLMQLVWSFMSVPCIIVSQRQSRNTKNAKMEGYWVIPWYQAHHQYLDETFNGEPEVKSYITTYINEQTKGELYIYLVDRNPSCIELLLWTLLQMDTITISCTEHYWHPQKRAIRMDSQTPSLGDGDLVHFSGPRLNGYNQLPLSPIVVTPTKVSLQNSILSLVCPHIVIQNKTPIRRSIHQMTTDRKW